MPIAQEALRPHWRKAPHNDGSFEVEKMDQSGLAGLLGTTLEYMTALGGGQKKVWLAEECRTASALERLERNPGFRLVGSPDSADIAILDHISDLNVLSRLSVGTGTNPTAATTAIVQVEEIDEYEGVTYMDPVTHTEKNLNPQPLPRTFWHFRERASASWETGLDIVFASPATYFSLPRWTRITYPKLY